MSKYYQVGYWVSQDTGQEELRVEEIGEDARNELNQVWWNGEQDGFDVEFTWVKATNEVAAKNKGDKLIQKYRTHRCDAMQKAMDKINGKISTQARNS